MSVITDADLLTGVGLGHHAGSTVRGFFADLVDEAHVVDRTIAERAAEMRAAHEAARFLNSDVGRELNLRGINARIVTGGTVRTGDAIRVHKRVSAGVRTPRPPP
jgi:hypothetical protein